MEINALTAFVGGLGTLIGILINVSRFSKDRDKDLRSSASEQAVINTKLDGIGNGVDSLRIDLKHVQSEQSRIMQELARNEEKVDSAHKRIDNAFEKIDKLECKNK